jgi:type I restriction-modification system DNA methylase subunit
VKAGSGHSRYGFLLNLQDVETIYDPACGTAGMLIAASAEVRRAGREHRTLGVFG